MKNSFVKFIVEQDIYGQPISIFYKGSDVFQTKMGSLCTLLTYTLLMVYGIALTEAFLDNSKQTESVQTLYYDRFNEGEFKLSEQSLSFVVVLPAKLDPKVGRIGLSQIGLISQT